DTGRSGVPFFYRLRCFISLVLGLRRHDFRSAAKFIAVEYGHLPFLSRHWQFLKWSLRQLWVVIPEAMPMLTVAPRVSHTPFWLDEPNPLENHPWQLKPESQLPNSVHTVVIGAGFTGAAAAYHWSKRAGSDQQLVVLEMNEAASAASGRNQGTIVMGRYFTMVRGTVEPYLAKVRSDLSSTQRRCLAEQFADVYCKAAYRNADLIEKAIGDEGFDVDYARKGWVQERRADQQEDLAESVSDAARTGNDDWISIDPESVYRESGMRVETPAGFSARAGTWHPAKWVWSLLTVALKSENVSLFTRTKVTSVEQQVDHYLIHTSRGLIRTQNVLYAVESFLPKLDSRFHNVIEPHQEQLATGTGTPEVMTCNNSITGKFFFGGRRDETLFIGSDSTRVPDHLAGCNKPCRFLTKFALSEYKRVYGPFAWRLTHEWSGTVGYTPDEYPLIGRLDDQGKYMIGGMAGSGSGVAFNAARCIVNRILEQISEPDDYPESFFGPTRILDPTAHHWPDQDESRVLHTHGEPLSGEVPTS
ncbi:MAG: FAD-binding oxidoreductase, partial [Fuerstiella sp.]